MGPWAPLESGVGERRAHLERAIASGERRGDLHVDPIWICPVKGETGGEQNNQVGKNPTVGNSFGRSGYGAPDWDPEPVWICGVGGKGKTIGEN